jgi:hypothetical protein
MQYISDIHLEMRQEFPRIKRLCNNLVLAGDIGSPKSLIYKQFIEYCSSNWKNVFVIYGNHEYYNRNDECFTMENFEDESKYFPNNVYFMNNNVLYLYKNSVSETLLTPEVLEASKTLLSGTRENPIKIIGSVLWSDITDFVASKMNDYKKIYTHKGNVGQPVSLTPKITRFLFEINKNYILRELYSEPELKCVIITHHGTHSLCQGHFKNSYLESGYATDISDLFQAKNLIACINGHTHSSINIVLDNGIKLLANCFGYPGENQKIVKYNEGAALEL